MNIIDKSLKYIWYPCAKMEDYKSFQPQHIKKAYGSYIETVDGKKIIDAVSSWWCKSLGHCHPRLQNALINQLADFEHVMQPHMSNEVIANLSEKLAKLTKNLKKVFYASDGSTVIEIALKMSLHAHKNTGNIKRTKFMSLSNGYHGETAATMSISDVGKYKMPYQDILFESSFIEDIPYVSDKKDELWNNCDSSWNNTEKFLERHKSTLAAIIIEPIVQGAGGMKIYSQDFINKLRVFTQENNIHLIADEIMTGLGRTGKMLACEHANIEPDFICLSKGLTSGMLPLSVCLTSQEIYDAFYNNDPFLHSNTHYGNALAASVALEVLNVFEDENIIEKSLQHDLIAKMQNIANSTGLLNNVRGIGSMVAADLIDIDGFKLYQKAMDNGAILRPLGNSIYWFPPLNISRTTLDELSSITELSLLQVNRDF